MNCFRKTARFGMMVLSLFLCAALFEEAASAAAPGAPVIGPASGGNRQVTINFTAPASDGGSPITGYTVTSNPGNLTATGSATPITVTGLTNGTPYTFAVTATNNDGTGASSVTPYFTTPRLYAPTSGTINNLVVFIRFSDQPEFTQPLSYYDTLFNSLKDFYLESSYNALTVNSTLYPSSSGTVTSYLDPNPSTYYQPYNASTNVIGYTTGAIGTARETALVANALNAITAQIPAGLNLDGDNDGYVDHICFEVYSTDINPLPVKFYSRATYDTSGGIILNGLKVGSYTWVTASQDHPDTGTKLASTEIHEMGHSFGYPDLRGNSGRTPVGDWDVMSMSKPVHSGAYMKNKFTSWITTIPEITSYGTYSINDITKPTNNSYKIKLSNNEFLVLEYRKAAAPFESNLPGSGLCITRVNEAAGMWGNLGGPPFFLYYYRPGGTFASDGGGSNSFACLNAETGRIQFNDHSNPACFLSDGSPCGISINNIGSTAGTSISFTYEDPSTTTVTRLVSGYLHNGGNRISGATVTLSGGASGVTTTDSLGRYYITVNEGGNYTITPTKANLTFAPANVSFSGITADQTQNFSAANNTNTISGTITSGGLPLGGVTVSCSGGNYPPPVTTDSSGTYTFTVNAGGDYDVRASKANYFFTPNSKVFTNITADQLQDFSTWTATVSLTGTVSNSGAPLSGVTVSCPGANTATPVTTSGSGTYSFTVTVGNGAVYTVTPSTPSYTFSPINRFYSGLVSSQVQNFTATAVNYSVSFNSNGGSAVGSQSVAYNSTATAPTAPARSGYTFAGWHSDPGFTAVFDFATAISADTALYAKWTINSYSVNFNSNGGSAVNSQNVPYSSTATAPTAPARSGYTFAGWYSDPGLTAVFDFTTAVTADITLYARWTINSYSVSFSSNGGSVVNSQNVPYSGTATTPAAPSRSGYTFAGWYGDAALAAPFIFSSTIISDTLIYAKWTAIALITYAVSSNVTAGADIIPASVQTIISGAAASFTVTPLAGYGILSVTGCGGSLNGTTYTTGAVNAGCSISVTTVARTGTDGSTPQPTIRDAVKVIRAVVNLTPLTATEQILYDVAPLSANGTPLGNGVLDIADAMLILRRSLGLVSW